jgi:prepilin-type N-terminal cleavage/methylation domain-containing protein
MQTKQSGFTLIELLIVLLIIGIIGSVVMPNLMRRTPHYEREQFIAGLNALMQSAFSQTVITHTLHQIYVDLKGNSISIRKHTGVYDKNGDPECVPVGGAYARMSQTIPEQLEFKQVFIEGVNELGGGAKKTKELWFYIIPEGLAQQVIFNMVDTKDVAHDDKPRSFGLVLNPFLVQFKAYDEFQKP